MTKTAIFRCDASLEIGSGHVFRCLTLADGLKGAGWDCHFAVSDETLEVLPVLSKSGYTLTALADLGQKKADLLIVDHYELEAEFESTCRDWADKILVIDDLADRKHDCDLLLDQTYGREASDYGALMPQSCSILVGAEYALLRPQFAEAREASLASRSGDVKTILVSLGSTNIHNVTSKVLDGLALYDQQALEIKVVLGSKAFAFDEVKDKVSALNESLHSAELLSDVEDMAGLMAGADLAIGAGGTTSWERCALGLPALIIEIADNQALISQELEKAGAIKYAGRVQDISAEDIRDDLSSLINAPEHIEAMIEAARRICDGCGVERTIQEIENVF